MRFVSLCLALFLFVSPALAGTFPIGGTTLTANPQVGPQIAAELFLAYTSGTDYYGMGTNVLYQDTYDDYYTDEFDLVDVEDAGTLVDWIEDTGATAFEAHLCIPVASDNNGGIRFTVYDGTVSYNSTTALWELNYSSTRVYCTWLHSGSYPTFGVTVDYQFTPSSLIELPDDTPYTSVYPALPIDLDPRDFDNWTP